MKRIVLSLSLSLVMVSVLFVVMAGQAPAGFAPLDEYELLVVRVYYGDQAGLQALADWREPWEVNVAAGYLVVEVTADEYAALQQAGYRVEVDERLTAEINAPRPESPEGGGIPGYACYRTVEETFTSAQQMVLDYPTLATWSDIGDSWDKVTPGGPAGYDINVLKLTNQAIPGPKPVLYVFGSIHAREYMPAEMATRFAEHMLDNYDVDADVTWLLDYHEIHLVLQANPDGRKFAEAGNLWRKNTNNTDGCTTFPNYGVDLNRNFTFFWNMGGSSSNPCDQTFHGSGPGSEPEAQALMAYGVSIIPDQRDDPITATAPITTSGIFIDLHSSGNVILWPWGIPPYPTANDTGMQTLARKMGFLNNYDPVQHLSYATAGTTKDFFYGELGIPSYTIETGTTFFQQCSYFENIAMPDNLQVLLYAAKASRLSYVIPAGPDVLNLALSSEPVYQGTPVELTATINDTRYNNSQGAEPVQNVVAAEYYIDVPFWITTTTPISIPLAAADGTFNNPVEAVAGTIDPTGLSLGRHTIFVRGQDADGNWGATTAIFMTVEAPTAPVAGFTSSSPDELGQTTVFTNTSTGGGLSYSWDFGDGGPGSTAEHPIHHYGAAGLYTVTLTVVNSAGSDVYVDTVEIIEPPQTEYVVNLPLVLLTGGGLVNRPD
jgi:carboxypeptidase T